jgi:4'-phosphopantetheinyl transferase
MIQIVLKLIFNILICLLSSTLCYLLTCRETHLWFIRPDEVKSTSLLKHYSQLLSPTEKEKVLQMRGDELKKNALLARTLVRTTIARCMVILTYLPSSFPSLAIGVSYLILLIED